MNATTKAIVLAVLASGSICGLGVHGLHTAENTPINAATAHDCAVFINHENRHKNTECDIEKLKLQLSCNK